MKRTGRCLVTGMLFLVAFPLVARGPLTIEEVVERVVEYDPSIRQAVQQLGRALERYELTRAAMIPNLAVTLTPYSYSRDRFTTTPESAVVTSRSAALGLELQQNLPTSGSITAGVSHRFQQTRRDGDTRIEQVPEVRVGYSQPLFFSSTVVDTSVFRAGRRSAEIAYEQAGLTTDARRNGSVREGLSLFVEVASLRRGVSLLQRTIDLVRRQLDVAELDREQGLLSDNAVLALQVTLNDRREALFDAQLGLVRTEQALARVLGEESLDGRPLDETALTTVFTQRINGITSIQENPTVRASRLGVEQARRDALLNDFTDRPQLDLSVSARPLYPADRDDPGNVSSSIDDYFESDADIAATFAVSLRIPLLTRWERASREAIDTTAAAIATIALEDTELATFNQLRTLQLNREFLTRRAEILDTDIGYQEQRLRSESDLLAAGASTQLRVDEVELDLVSRRNEAWKVSAELFLNALDILGVGGYDIASEVVGGAIPLPLRSGHQE